MKAPKSHYYEALGQSWMVSSDSSEREVGGEGGKPRGIHPVRERKGRLEGDWVGGGGV